MYTAAEGVNAQMAVPCADWASFEAACRSVPALAAATLNRDGVIVAAAGGSGRGDGQGQELPFHDLSVRVRPQVLADGLAAAPAPGCEGGMEDGVDWAGPRGEELTPAEWHAELAAADKVGLLGAAMFWLADRPTG